MVNARIARLGRVAIGLGALIAVFGACAVLAGPVTLLMPRSCLSCHVPEAAFDSLKTSPHAAVRCERCHTDRAVLAGVGNSVALIADTVNLLRPGRGGSVRVSDEACLACHKDIGREAPFVTDGLRMSHAGLVGGEYRCTWCHPGVAHPVTEGRLPGPTMSMCSRCHDDVKASGKCIVCHPIASKRAQARLSDPEWSKTHGATWRQTHGMGDLSTCMTCHRPAACKRCHGDVTLPHGPNFIAVHGTQAMRPGSRCVTCHIQSFCDSCHGIKMPHPTGFLAVHSKVAVSFTDPRCMKCHTEDNCAECHTKHIHPYGGVRL